MSSRFPVSFHAPPSDAHLASVDDPIEPVYVVDVSNEDKDVSNEDTQWQDGDAEAKDESMLTQHATQSENEMQLEGELAVLNQRFTELVNQHEAAQQREAELQARVDELTSAAEAWAQASATAAPSAEMRAKETEELKQQLHDEKRQIEALMNSITQGANALQAEFKTKFIEMETTTAELAISIASRLIHHKIETDDFPVESLVREAVRRLETEDAVVIRLHPDDVTLLKRRLGDDGQILSDRPDIEIEADDSLARGDCSATAGSVSVASHLEDQLADIKQHLLVSE